MAVLSSRDKRAPASETGPAMLGEGDETAASPSQTEAVLVALDHHDADNFEEGMLALTAQRLAIRIRREPE